MRTFLIWAVVVLMTANAFALGVSIRRSSRRWMYLNTFAIAVCWITIEALVFR